MNNSSAGSTRATASRNRRVSPASRSLIDAPSENAPRDEADHMCAKEGGASPVEGTPLHVHEREEEAWFVLEEEKVGHRKFTAPAGSFVIAPRGIPPAHKSADRIPRGSSPSCRLLV